jgi:acetyl coenzyme A synthetase (ADP forming)-like protein
MPKRADPPGRWDSDVVLADGTTVRLRPMRRDDDEGVHELCRRLSQESLYFRFFTAMPPERAGDIELLAPVDYDHHFALVAERRGDIIAIARYDRSDADRDEAEVAFMVRDDQQGLGVGTILLEHIAAVALEHGIRRFVAYTLARNHRMLGVFSEVGFDTHRSFEDGALRVWLDLAPSDGSVAAQERREQVSEARSVARLLRPSSIAVVGASRERRTIGNAVLQNVRGAGFAGEVYAVNRGAAAAGVDVEGLPAYPSVRDIPGDVGLAVVCVPAAQVMAVAEDCVRKRVGGLVVISAGFAEVGDTDAQHRLVELLRVNGVRLVGPNCIGVVNTSEAVRMNATFLPAAPQRGRVGLASQSGGLAIELLSRAGAVGLGVSTFVSMGNKADISGNDLLQYWAEDPDTDVIVLYLESFGNPHKFARLARRIALAKPIIAVKGGRTLAGARGASSHTAALASPDVAVDALFRQAGVIRVDTLEQLFETASVVLHQPLPTGCRVAIVTNGGGPGILAADACTAAGLEVPVLDARTQAALRAVTAAEASVTNPVDLIASASADVYLAALRVVLADPQVDAVLVIFVPPLVTEADDVARAIVAAAAEAGDTTVVACFLGRNGVLDVLNAATSASETRQVPSFAFPESAAAALGRAAGLAEWRQRPQGRVPELEHVDAAAARRRAADALENEPEGVWLDTSTVFALLGEVGIPMVATRVATTADEAAAAADQVGYPVALKVAATDIVHKTDVGGVRLGLVDAADVRSAYGQMHSALGERMASAVVQPMAETGVETIVGITRDPSFGPLVLFGMGGIAAELTRDTALRIVPLTDVDAHELVRSLRSSPLLFGYRGTPKVDVAALEDVILRVGLLAAHVPEIAELDCNPVIVTPGGALVVDAKLRVAGTEPSPPEGIRRLRDA